MTCLVAAIVLLLLSSSCRIDFASLSSSSSSLSHLSARRALTRTLLLVVARQRSERSWTPWLVSLAVEAASLHIQSIAAESTAGDRARLEATVAQRRRALMLYYLLRRPAVDVVVDAAARVPGVPLPGVASLGSFVRDFVRSYGERYFFTASI